MSVAPPDVHARLAEAGRVLVAAHKRLLAKAKQRRDEKTITRVARRRTA